MSAGLCIIHTSDGRRLALRYPPPAVFVLLTIGAVVHVGDPIASKDSGAVRYAFERIDPSGVFHYDREGS